MRHSRLKQTHRSTIALALLIRFSKTRCSARGLGHLGMGDGLTKPLVRPCSPGGIFCVWSAPLGHTQYTLTPISPLLSPLLISRSNASPITPAVLPPTHYLQLPTPASTSCGSQQPPRLCNQGVYRSNTAVDEVELLTDAGTWLEVQSTCAMVSSSEQVRAAPVCAAPLIFLYSLDPLCCAFTLASALCLCTLPPHCANVCTHICALYHCRQHNALTNGLSGEPQPQRDRCAPAKAPVLCNATRRH